MSQPQEASSIKDKVDFVYVINHALLKCYDARSRIVWSEMLLDLRNSILAYQAAVSSLYVMVSPIIPVSGISGLLEEADKYVLESYDVERTIEGGVSGLLRESVRLLDQALSAMVSTLREAGLLFREERIRIGVGSVSEG